MRVDGSLDALPSTGDLEPIKVESGKLNGVTPNVLNPAGWVRIPAGSQTHPAYLVLIMRLGPSALARDAVESVLRR